MSTSIWQPCRHLTASAAKHRQATNSGVKSRVTHSFPAPHCSLQSCRPRASITLVFYKQVNTFVLSHELRGQLEEKSLVTKSGRNISRTAWTATVVATITIFFLKIHLVLVWNIEWNDLLFVLEDRRLNFIVIDVTMRVFSTWFLLL